MCLWIIKTPTENILKVFSTVYTRTYMYITYTDKSQLEEVNYEGKLIYSTKYTLVIRSNMNEDIEIDKTLHV